MVTVGFKNPDRVGVRCRKAVSTNNCTVLMTESPAKPGRWEQFMQWESDE